MFVARGLHTWAQLLGGVTEGRFCMQLQPVLGAASEGRGLHAATAGAGCGD
jgi:hypothetical protein